MPTTRAPYPPEFHQRITACPPGLRSLGLMVGEPDLYHAGMQGLDSGVLRCVRST